ncbi:ribonucleoside triphosphate reductase [Candidatus Woesearchaeota archaeon CG_4_10_14_0_2_um_filter_33_10]|nr:MAG: ribonucleoside triphosphate reductase [Candidatus Woesearchaeota archaeon CG1_02_33_12]PIN78405.1 MAG: ribonucleoside triphosphate reductase [Candidatus Woesearchaeota archaeon CG10_big_fil_rev_8_21_14_0_10_33_12]PIU72440.1 MAG: ribonucleoside triphosphate reductase [Candidatus Woesearchaeota archaeon CG06_land_8_20_14_3_00_33_13]PIZ52977.1 MAG: ribonucleoside triphosphate reductase [Candidatus Woesearchaeota archaeon CG_4_10_14_0_2_um_filter_33_10]
MLKHIKKRNGKIVNFEKEKIVNALFNAGEAVGKKNRKKAEELADKVVKILKKDFSTKIPTIENVQDIVERILIEEGDAKTAKAYVLYREQHKNIRETAKLLRDIKIVDDYLKQLNWRVRENSNMAYSLQGLNVHITYTVISNYWLNNIYPKEVREAHLNGNYHIHDLGTLGAYCVGWDLRDILISGFKGVIGKIESKPAKHFNVALMQIVNFLYTLQGEAAGAQALSNFDTLLAPLIRYDNLSYKQVKQGMQEFLFNMNVPTRTGFQTPFTNVTLDLNCPDYMKDENVIIGGKLKEETYKNFQKEMGIFNKVFAELMIEGDAKGRPFTFPIPTYNITKDFDWGNKDYDPIWEMTSKYGTPYFSNFINSDMSPDDARSMCCRLRLDKRKLKKRGGGLFGSDPLTGSIGVVTINIPRIGYEAKNEEEFFKELERLMELAKESLIIKRKVLEIFTEKGLYPYSIFYLRNIKKGFKEYWKNHFSTIGLIGVNDALLNFKNVSIADEEGLKFAEKIMDFMRNKIADFQEETGDIFNLEATPAEGASYRLAKIDKKKYPDIKIFNQEKYDKNAEPYYTNSTQLPAGFTDDIFEALELQDQLQTKYTGGTVLHGFLGESMPSAKATKSLVRKIAENFKLPYFTITPTFSICPGCGYIAGKHKKCPKCGKICEIWSRPVGYLRPVEQWNNGKQAEFKDRKTFDKQIKEN